ncbi:MAG: SIMPL domain-containing protein [Candidatus Marsarchaeota archaeon]|nr:SIMPL domain-containing protein [Candidatus Marsarchaeota archaeon]MCL5106144.1 SIMPL domain-containing protein [Candidatus Marsarchaeota archaeon]
MKDNVMYSLLVIVILVLLSAIVFQLYFFSNLLNKQSSVNLQNSNALVWLKTTNSSFIFITASGSASAMPDFATVFVLVQAFGNNPASATNNMSFALHDLNASVLKYINGNLSNIRTTYFNVYNRSNVYNFNASGKKFYAAQESLSIRIPNINNISNAIGAISGVNGTSITNVVENLSSAQIALLRAQALSAAMQNATSQASLLSQNKTLAIKNITVNYYRLYPFSLSTGALNMASSQIPQAPSFFIGNDTITQSITVTFSFAK